MRGRTFYVSGGVLYVLSGAVHAIAHMQPPSLDPAVMAAEDAMGQATLSMGLTTTMFHAMECLAWYMTTFSVLVGLLALTLAGRCKNDAWLLRQLSALLAIGAGVLAAFAFHYRVLPPAVLYTITAVLFVVAAVRAKQAAVAPV